jgi:predicted house-cleaning NTP pyrophosphatase (Maf/HAM1 superfamily)
MKKLIVALLITATTTFTACAARQDPGPASAPEADVRQQHENARLMCQKYEQVAETQNDAELVNQFDQICADIQRVEDEWLAGKPYNELKMASLVLKLVGAQHKIVDNHMEAIRNMRIGDM